jgi:ubiquinone/menaquinone biosynthesis C-methylase UbiE
MWVPNRRLDPEWMDRPDSDPLLLERALRDIRLVNRRLGGTRALLRGLDPFFSFLGADEPLEVLDVGTGGGDLAVAIARHAERRGSRVRVTALDRDAVSTSIARREAMRRPEVAVVRGDAFSLPFGDSAFHVATASLILHHFSHPDAVRFLRSLRRVARFGVVVNDLHRHLLPWAFIGAAARLTRRSPMFVHDAPLSVLRGFTRQELLAAAREAGDTVPRLQRVWPYRWVLTLRGELAG